MSTSGQTETEARGRPREAFEFIRGGQHWRLTSNSSDILLQQGSFRSANISRGAIEFTPDPNRDAITITLDKDEEVAKLLRGRSQAEVVAVIIYRAHEEFTDSGESSFPVKAEVIWSGRVLSEKLSGLVVEMNCEPSSTSLKRVGLRRLWQRQCPHVLYDSSTCKVASSSKTVTAAVTAISGSTITVSAVEGGMYPGGLLEWVNPATSSIEARMIKDQEGNVLTLSYNIPSLVVNDVVTLAAGCNHTSDNCLNKFDNLNNYGGAPFIPESHPFGTTIY